MVRVVNEGPDPSIVKQIVCRNCGCTLEYLPFEVKRYEGKDYGGGPAGREWIYCPRCSEQVTIRSW